MRGAPPGPFPFGPLASRSRLEVRFGRVAPGPRQFTPRGSLVLTEAGTWGLMLGLTYLHWWREDLALALSGTVLGAKASAQVSGTSVVEESLGLTSLLVGVRKYGGWPFGGGQVRPFAAAAAGPYIGSVHSRSVCGIRVAAARESESA